MPCPCCTLPQGLNALVMISSWVRDRALADAAADVKPGASRAQVLSVLRARGPAHKPASLSGSTGTGRAQPQVKHTAASGSASGFVSQLMSRAYGAAEKARGAALQRTPAKLRAALRMA